MKTVISGIQPTSIQPHIGNYFGTLANWVQLQDKYNCKYFIADYHSISSDIPIKDNTLELIINLVSIGIKPENLFIQSLSPQHTELQWLLNSYVSVGELSKMTQYKDKNKKFKDGFIPASLLNYPILQAADILLHKADYVPIGKDQEQHLQLTKDIAIRFNSTHNCNHFTIPEPLYSDCTKIMSLANSEVKMSKSLGDKHCIYLFEDELSIRNKVKIAVTDNSNVLPMNDSVNNLFNILKQLNIDLYNEFIELYNKQQCKFGILKQVIADELVKLTNQFKDNKLIITNSSLEKQEIIDKMQMTRAKLNTKCQMRINEIKELMKLT